MDLSFLRREKALPGLCCLYLLPNKLIVTHALFERDIPTITFVESIDYQAHSLHTVLEHIIKKNGLHRIACSWVLHTNYYHLFLLDPPSVPEKEMALALRWQVKELIDFPAEAAAIEYFSVSFAADMKKKVYVAAAKKAELQMIVDVMNDVGLNLQHIDITELALRNINALYGDDQCYLGLLAFQHDCIEFIITSHHHLLLSRRLALPQNIHTNEIPSQWLSDLIVEIHNSFTYCNSQQRSEVPDKLLVLTSTASLISQLGQSLNIETRPLTLEKKINLDFIMPSDDYLSLHYLIAIGGALRGKYDVAGH